MLFNILCPATGVAVTLPVTPSEYLVNFGKKIRTMTLYNLGDLNLAGGSARTTIKIDALFPARKYPFANTSRTDFAREINLLKTWAVGKELLRLVITETDINLPVLLQDVQVGEKDGTRDRYVTMTFRQYIQLLAPTFYTEQPTSGGTVQASAEGTEREVEKEPEHVSEHVVVSTDTLSGICLKYYGNANLYPQLAKYNGIANPNLIYDGDTIRIPDKSMLGG